MTLVATAVPFTYLNDLISAGVIEAFCLTDSSLVVKCAVLPPSHPPGLLEGCLGLCNALCFITVLVWTHESKDHLKMATVACVV